jgi:hypothetical protein
MSIQSCLYTTPLRDHTEHVASSLTHRLCGPRSTVGVNLSASVDAYFPTALDNSIEQMLDFLCSHLKIHDTSQFTGMPARREQHSLYYNSPLPGGQAERIRVILDAIVALAQPCCRQVLAMTLATSKAEVRLCIAQNDTRVPPSVEQFLCRIWDQLQAISKQYASAMVLAKLPWKPLADGSSPKAVHGNKTLNELGRKLRREVYQHVYPRFMQRVMKRHAPFVSFRQYFNAKLDPNNGFDVDFGKVLCDAAGIVEFVVKEQTLDTTSSDDLVTKIEALNRRLKTIQDKVDIKEFDRTTLLQVRLNTHDVFLGWKSQRRDPDKR